MSRPLARWALMLGNFVVAVAIVGIARMLPDLAKGLGVTIAQAVGAGLFMVVRATA